MISISPTKKRKLYKLNTSHEFMFLGQRYLIPKGFETDGASIPRVCWSLIGHPFSPRFIEAAIVHDYCCVHKMKGSTRDALFRFNLEKAHVSKWRRNMMYAAVVSYRKVRYPQE